MEVKEWGKSFSLPHKQSRITASESPPAAQTHQQPPPHSPRLSLRHIRVFRRSARIWLIYLITRYIIRTDLKHTHSLSDRPQPTNGTDAVSIISGNAYVCKCQQRGCVCQCVFVLGSGRTVFFARLSDRAGSEKDRLDMCFPDCVEGRSPSVVSLTVDETTFHPAFVPTYTERFIRLFFAEIAHLKVWVEENVSLCYEKRKQRRQFIRL